MSRHCIKCGGYSDGQEDIIPSLMNIQYNGEDQRIKEVIIIKYRSYNRGIWQRHLT